MSRDPIGSVRRSASLSSAEAFASVGRAMANSSDATPLRPTEMRRAGASCTRPLAMLCLRTGWHAGLHAEPAAVNFHRTPSPGRRHQLVVPLCPSPSRVLGSGPPPCPPIWPRLWLRLCHTTPTRDCGLRAEHVQPRFVRRTGRGPSPHLVGRPAASLASEDQEPMVGHGLDE